MIEDMTSINRHLNFENAKKITPESKIPFSIDYLNSCGKWEAFTAFQSNKLLPRLLNRL